MKKAILSTLMLCLLGTALAAPNPTPTPTPLESSAQNLFSSFGDTWNAFTGMATEAGNAFSQWADGVAKDADAYLRANLPEVSAWLDETTAYFNQNVSPEVNAAWQTLTDGAAEVGTHTRREMQAAYDTLMEQIDSGSVDAGIKDTVNAIAGAAGLDVKK